MPPVQGPAEADVASQDRRVLRGTPRLSRGCGRRPAPHPAFQSRWPHPPLTRLQTPPSPAHGLVPRPRSRRPAWLLRVTPARVPRGAAPSASSVSHSVPVGGCTERTRIHSTNVYEALTPQPRRPREDEEMWTLNPGWKSEWPSHTQGHGAGGRNPRQENREPP